MASACEKICAGDFIGEIATKAAARKWLPAAMLFDAVHASDTADDQTAIPDGTDGVADLEDIPERDAA